MQRSLMALPLLFAAGLALNACSERASPLEPVAASATAPSSTDDLVAGRRADAHTTIDVDGGTFQAGLDINDRGVIVGRYLDASDRKTYGFRRSANGEPTRIQYPGAVFTVAAAINNRGDIVGQYCRPEVGRPCTAAVRNGYLLRDGDFTSIDPRGSIRTNVLGINDRGDIVGRYVSADGRTHGFLFSGGTFTTIDYPGAKETNLWDINRRGEIVGSFVSLDGKSHLFVLWKGRFTAIDLPGVVDINADKGGINSRGDIVGVYCDVAPCKLGPTGTHGFVLSGDDITTIDPPGAPATVAFGINARRDVVGAYYDAKGEAHAFVLSGRRRDDEEKRDSDHDE